MRALRQERQAALRADPRHCTIAPGVAFCGDGANDVGALRAADVSVGRSLSRRAAGSERLHRVVVVVKGGSWSDGASLRVGRRGGRRAAERHVTSCRVMPRHVEVGVALLNGYGTANSDGATPTAAAAFAPDGGTAVDAGADGAAERAAGEPAEREGDEEANVAARKVSRAPYMSISRRTFRRMGEDDGLERTRRGTDLPHF